jgi:hypothetical protein
MLYIRIEILWLIDLAEKRRERNEIRKQSADSGKKKSSSDAVSNDETSDNDPPTLVVFNSK